MNVNDSMDPISLAVVGGGYGGLCAALMASKAGFKVTVFERQEKPLKKLALTGNGRCNISNENISLSDYVTSDKDALEKILSAFSREKENAFFDDLGLVLRSDESRLYPVTGKAVSVLDALRYRCNEEGVTFVCDTNVTEVKKDGDFFCIKTTEKTLDNRFDYCLLACGGSAGVYKESSFNGFEIAKAAGHKINPVFPALTKVICESSEQKALKKLDGIRIRASVRLLTDNGEEAAFESGELQITAKGLSGIPVFDLTRYMRKGDCRHYSISVDFLPDFLDEDFGLRLDRFATRSLETFFTGLLLPPIVSFICDRMRVNIHKRMADLSRQESENLRSMLHDCRFSAESTGSFENAQISCGGIPLSELDDHLGSKKMKGLYMIGEMLDVAGRCGGYNLHFAAAGANRAVEGMKKDAENR